MLHFLQSSSARRGLRAAAGCLLVATSAAGIAGAESSKKVFTEAELAGPAPGPNPFLSTPAAGVKVDRNYWRARIAYESRLHADRVRADREPGLGFPEAGGSAVSEIEPNDSNAEAQGLADFGTGAGDVATVSITASIAPPVPPTPLAPAAEDDGNINAASPTGLSSGQSVTAMGQIGDGPYGSSGTRRGDFDFFRVAGVQAGQILSMEVQTPSPQDDLDPNCALWDSAGNLLEFHEDLGITTDSRDFDCRLVVEAPADGDYYFSIGGWQFSMEDRSQLLPRDPFDSNSGFGVASEGVYTVTLGLDAVDRDCFTFGLVPGDVLGTSSSGGDRLTVRVTDPSGVLRMGSITDRTSLYPDASPMPRGGVVGNVVAVESGDYTVCFDGRPADYGAELRVFRPVVENSADRQTFFVDFDGATLDLSVFSFPWVATLSPLSSFLANWGLGPGDEDAVIDSILETVRENLVDDLRPLSNPSFSVQILNSRDHEDPFGQPNVSRIIIGGSIAETGVQVVSIAQSIDPGNFVGEETALIQLDELSATPGDFTFYTLNGVEIAADASKIDLVGRALGNIASQEAGYLSGVWNTELALPGSPATIMDGLVDNRAYVSPLVLPSPIGLGPDRIFGTSDDVDVDFAEDRFSLHDRFMGFQDTAEVLAHTLSRGNVIFADGFESGTTEAWTFSRP
ncbi:MAG: hypothetical protein AAGF23_23475 [Acidobacteriota bacterium]